MTKSSLRTHGLLVGTALLLALLFVIAVREYYGAYHFGVGAKAAATVLGLPSAFILALGIGYLTRWVFARGRPGGRSAPWVALAMVLGLAALFFAEWLRTTKYRGRSEEATLVQPSNDALNLPGA